MNPETTLHYDPEHRRHTPHAPAAWQLTDGGIREHLAAITVRNHLMDSVRKHGEHQGEPFLTLAAAQLVAIARREALRVVDEPLPFCPVAARRIVDGWATFGMQLRAMRSGIAA